MHRIITKLELILGHEDAPASTPPRPVAPNAVELQVVSCSVNGRHPSKNELWLKLARVEIMIIEPFKIENESEADYYLSDLLAKPEYRSMNEVNMRAQKYITNEYFKNYFINKAKDILRTYGYEI